MEKRAAEVDLALAPERQEGGDTCMRVCDGEFRRWFGDSTGQGWLGCVGAGCGGFVRIIALPSLCLRLMLLARTSCFLVCACYLLVAFGLRCLAFRHRQSGCNNWIVHTDTGHYLHVCPPREPLPIVGTRVLHSLPPVSSALCCTH